MIGKNYNKLTSPQAINIDRIEEISDSKVLKRIIKDIANAYRQLRSDITSLNYGDNRLKQEVDDVSDEVSASSNFDIPMISGANFAVNQDSRIVWDDCTIKYKGVIYNIPSGTHNPQGMDSVIYWKDSSPNVLLGMQADGAIDSGNWYLAYYQIGNNSVYPTFQSFIINGGLIQTNTITALQIHSDAITATEIAANTITAAEIDVDDIFTQEITVSNTGSIHSDGKLSYSSTTAGWWLGYDTNNYKLNIGNDTEYLKWNGSNLSIECSGGKLGSSTNYFDISSGHLFLTNASDNYQLEVYSSFLKIHKDGSSFLETIVSHTGLFSGHIAIRKSGSSNYNQSDCSIYSDPVYNRASFGDISGKYIEWIGPNSNDLNQYLKSHNMELVSCVVTTDSVDTEGSLRWDSTNHKLQVYSGTGWETVTSS